MTEQDTPCCDNNPASFLVTYKINPLRKFSVCNFCIHLEQYSRGIKDKIPISEIIGPGRQTRSELEVTIV